MSDIIGFSELFTSYSRSSEKHARGVYALTSFYHTPKDWNMPFRVKIGMSMNLYQRMNNYNLYYPESYWMLGFVFLPLSADDNEVLALERSIHAFAKPQQWTSEWFTVKNYGDLAQILTRGSKDFNRAKVITDLSKRINLPPEYIPMPLKDKKVIDRIAREYEREKQQRENEKKKRLEVKRPNSSRGPAYNTRFFNLKRGNVGSQSNPIVL